MASQRTRRPLIGVTAGSMELMSGAWTGHRAVVVTEHYVKAIRAAGARAVVIGAQDEWTAEEVAELDGLVLTGGSDLDPSAYGGEDLPTALASDPARDEFELALYRAAREAGVPILGICRGLQLINVAEGGTLLQHLPEDLPAHPVTGERVTEVDARIEAASDLAVAVGTRVRVRSFHHQGIGTIGAGLRPVARHDSTLVLALEAADGSPVTAVQWHPELDVREKAGAGLFAAFVAQIRREAEQPAPARCAEEAGRWSRLASVPTPDAPARARS